MPSIPLERKYIPAKYSVRAEDTKYIPAKYSIRAEDTKYIPAKYSVRAEVHTCQVFR